MDGRIVDDRLMDTMLYARGGEGGTEVLTQALVFKALYVSLVRPRDMGGAVLKGLVRY